MGSFLSVNDASPICRWVSFPSADGKTWSNSCDPQMGCPSADGKPICGSANGSDPSADGSDRQMGSNIYIRDHATQALNGCISSRSAGNLLVENVL